MKATKLIPALFAVAVVLFVLKSFLDHSVPKYTFPDWEHGASGYRVALKEAMEGGRPLILYFHTSWCGWCEKLDRNYLSTEEMVRFLRDIPKVEINPDKGEAEKAIFNKFGLTGYPSFLVLNFNLSPDPVQLSPFLNTGTLSVKEFLDKIREVTAVGSKGLAH